MHYTVLISVPPPDQRDIDTFASDADLSFLTKDDTFDLKILDMDNYASTINAIPIDSVIINLCDGNDTDGSPGMCVLKMLEEQKRIFLSLIHI